MAVRESTIRRRSESLARFDDDAGFPHRVDLTPDLIEARSQVLQHVRSYAFTFDEQSEQDVLCTNVAIAHPARLLEGDLDDTLHARGRDDVLNDDPLASAAGGADDIAGIGDVDAQAAQHLAC